MVSLKIKCKFGINFKQIYICIQIDASNLESVFAMLGFDVTRYNDLNTLDLSINLRQSKPSSL